MSQKIVPNLWFDGNASQAVDFYRAAFDQSKVVSKSYYPTEGLLDFQKSLAGKILTIDFELNGFRFTAINAGPEFKPNASISFMLNFDPASDKNAEKNLDKLWQKLSDGGEVLMALGEYPFSKRYGWIKDKFGYSWQLILTDPSGDERPFIIPSLLFGQAQQNRAEQAIKFYTDVFRHTKTGTIARYTQKTGPANKNSIMFADFMLEQQWFAAMDSGVEQDFSFNEAISLVVNCQDQAEIDYYWQKLSTVPEAEQCGWCKDQFGVSWQIVPANIDALMKKPQAFSRLMDMKKIEIDKL